MRRKAKGLVWAGGGIGWARTLFGFGERDSEADAAAAPFWSRMTT